MFKFKFLGIDWDFTFIKRALILIVLLIYYVILPLIVILATLIGLFGDYYLTVIGLFSICAYAASYKSIYEKLDIICKEDM